jgi:hypothetical protein
LYEEVFDNNSASLYSIVRSNVVFLGIERNVCVLWRSTVCCCFGTWACEVDGVRGKTYKRLIMKLIDKDAVLAEIENRIRACGNCYILDELTSLHRTFDSIEVKEMENSNYAFIEKACEWLENNLQGIVGGSIYIEDFRKHMIGD